MDPVDQRISWGPHFEPLRRLLVNSYWLRGGRVPRDGDAYRKLIAAGLACFSAATSPDDGVDPVCTLTSAGRDLALQLTGQG